MLASYRLFNSTTGRFITRSDYVRAIVPDSPFIWETDPAKRYATQVWYSFPPSTSEIVKISESVMIPVSALEIDKLFNGYTFDPEN